MRLIEFDGQDYKVSDEAFLLRPIRDLFEADKTKSKEKFWQQISYLWCMHDPRSPYMYIVDPEERSKEVKIQEGLPDSWQPSDELKKAIDMYRGIVTTTSSILLESMRKGADKIRIFLEGLDLFALDKNGKPIHQVSSITSTLRQIPELSKALAEAEKALAKDFATEDSARGNLRKAIGEDL